MHSKNHLKKFMQLKQKGPIECQDIEQMHKFFETYMKYIALTYLRMKGGKYETVQTYVRKSWISCNEKTLKKILLHFFNQDKRNQHFWNKLMQQHPHFKVRLQLLFDYASKVRNYIFHGNYYPFQKEEKRFIFDIYLDCIHQIEFIISQFHSNKTILNSKPSDFTCQATQFTTQAQLRNLLSFHPTELPISYKMAQQLLQPDHDNAFV